MLGSIQLRQLQIRDLNDLNIVHISGTKGKGSTCSFVSSLLLSHGKTSGYPRKIGLYTSPHLKSTCERIRINNKPISKELFTRCFFDVWDKLPREATPSLDIPRYLQLLALMSYHVFITEDVDMAIYETHLGGEFDATNIVKKPVVTAIASIAMDHVRLLGPTLEEIAWHKAGIFKREVQAFSTVQHPSVTAVLKRRAAERNTQLAIIGIDPELPFSAVSLKPEVQKVNCSLALSVTRAWLKLKAPRLGTDITSEDIIRGIEGFYWPGRFQVISEHNLQWFLDGAHNEISVQHAVQWYVEAIERTQKDSIQILIFSHFSERDGAAILRCIAVCLQKRAIRMQHVIFTSYEERMDGTVRIGKQYTALIDSM